MITMFLLTVFFGVQSGDAHERRIIGQYESWQACEKHGQIAVKEYLDAMKTMPALGEDVSFSEPVAQDYRCDPIQVAK